MDLNALLAFLQALPRSGGASNLGGQNTALMELLRKLFAGAGNVNALGGQPSLGQPSAALPLSGGNNLGTSLGVPSMMGFGGGGTDASRSASQPQFGPSGYSPTVNALGQPGAGPFGNSGGGIYPPSLHY